MSWTCAKCIHLHEVAWKITYDIRSVSLPPLAFNLLTHPADYFPLSRGLNSETQKVLGGQLAQMHDPKNPDAVSPEGKYGFHVPTHCGATEQVRISLRLVLGAS